MLWPGDLMNVFQPMDDVVLAGRLVNQPDWSTHVANAVLRRAKRLDVDVMSVLAHAVPGDPELPYRRAAEIIGVGYASKVESAISPADEGAHLDDLAHLRSARGQREGEDTLFLVPRFKHIRLLAERVALDPSLGKRLCIVSPSTLRKGIVEANEEHLSDNALQRLARRSPWASAHLDLPIAKRLGFVAMVLATMAASMVWTYTWQPLLLTLITCILAAPSLFRLWAAFRFQRDQALRPEIALDEDELPIYSVLIPLNNEAHMVPQIVAAMNRLDYPAEKLDIIFVVESASPETIEAVEKELANPAFSLIAVPKRRPYTKPKALNYALPMARGEFVVVYDAEDVPNARQLRDAAAILTYDPTLECLQAELVIANASRRWVTKMFAGEYAGHFGVFLPAVGLADLPVPLGGTSNHFRTETLRRIGAWDAFNVTEDADLGIRMARMDMRIKMFAGTTLEEAPEHLPGWIKQRSRWLKGWMQTLLVHSARPSRLLDDLGLKRLTAFYVFVGGMVLSISLHGLFVVFTLGRLAFDILTAGVPGIFSILSLIALLFGYCGAAAVSVIGLERVGRPELMRSLFGLPLYWLLAWYALVIAIYELVRRPYHWSKTTHKGGLSIVGAAKAARDGSVRPQSSE